MAETKKSEASKKRDSETSKMKALLESEKAEAAARTTALEDQLARMASVAGALTAKVAGNRAHKKRPADDDDEENEETTPPRKR